MGRPKGSKNKPKNATVDALNSAMLAQLNKKATRKYAQLTDEDFEINCAACPKPRKENRSQPTFSRLEVSTMVLIAALTFSWFVSDWLASL